MFFTKRGDLMSKKNDNSVANRLKGYLPNGVPTNMFDKYAKDFDLADQLMKQAADQVNEFQKVNIIVMGKTGVGKSTLINNLFRDKLAETGTGKPVTQHLHRISKEGIPLTLYDTKGLELSSDVQKEITNEIFEYIDTQNGTDEEIHLIYYAIHAQSNRIEETEIELIKQLSEKVPVLIVLTQAMGVQSEEFEAYIDNLNLPVTDIQRVMAEPFKINKDVTIERFGLDTLVEQSFTVLPEVYHKAFNNVQQANIKRKVKAARNWALGYNAMTFGVGFTPIPFTDSSVLVPIQITMLAHITGIFGIDLDRATIVSLIAAVGGTGSAKYVGRSIVSNALKAIPGVGTVVGGLISGTTAAAITTTLAFSYIEVLAVMAQAEANGVEITPNQLKKMMQERFSKRMKKNKEEVNIEELEAVEETKWEKVKESTKNLTEKIPNPFKRK